ncbi:Aldo/keto reductase [Zopfia rhizophila CBS 207.26]|uniref:Aldo/keto reductase n=1 Tax=Zopfia rhizophila CBS 207.26 TaxID=1314779 RepID=A0A6A6E3C3_9PEZI|nr:Aldo/keto reductase [Zopfia rhizophila CBS 207.26]
MAAKLIFGTASFGMDLSEFQDVESLKNLLKTLQALNIHRLDSSTRYPPLKPGRSEELIGEARELSRSFIVDTKVYTNTQTDGSGDLSREAMQKSVSGSLQRLQRPEGVNVLHAHRVDPATPLGEQIQGFNEQSAQGNCKAWELSNTSPAVLEKILHLCEQKGWQKPSYYQGNYNLVTRGMEMKLLPILRAHGISYNGFQPLAAGFLTGKLVNNQHAGTRFGNKNPLGKTAQGIFGAEDLLNAMKNFDEEVKV